MSPAFRVGISDDLQHVRRRAVAQVDEGDLLCLTIVVHPAADKQRLACVGRRKLALHVEQRPRTNDNEPMYFSPPSGFDSNRLRNGTRPAKRLFAASTRSRVLNAAKTHSVSEKKPRICAVTERVRVRACVRACARARRAARSHDAPTALVDELLACVCNSSRKFEACSVFGQSERDATTKIATWAPRARHNERASEPASQRTQRSATRHRRRTYAERRDNDSPNGRRGI